MMKRPSCVRFRKCTMHRRTFRYCCEYLLCIVLLLLFGLRFLTCAIFALFAVILFEAFVFRRK